MASTLGAHPAHPAQPAQPPGRVRGLLAGKRPLRRHHAFSDQEGDPHSPWAFGTSPAALARGFWHAHLG